MQKSAINDFQGKLAKASRSVLNPKLLVFPVLFALLAAVATYFLVNAYVLHQARQNVRDILLSHRGLHLYIQRTMHPEFFRARTNQEITTAYYAPEILSSSFMVRVLHGYYNEERTNAGLPQVYYKMAADNPRNPVNKADEAEVKLLEYFRSHPGVREYSQVEKVDGKTCLVFAMPFLRTEERCLACHGKRQEAPPGVQVRYAGNGGYGDKVGNLRAIESLRVPIEEERSMAFIGTLAALAGFGAIGILLVFNRLLNRTVRARTGELASRERSVRRLLDAAEPVPFEYVPETERFTFVGPQFRTLFGGDPSRLQTGEDWESLVHPGDRDTALRACREATRRGEDHDCALRVVTHDGQLKIVHQTINIVKEDGKPLQVVGFMHDVTAQRRDEAIQKARLSIAESAVEASLDALVQRLIDESEKLTGSTVGFFHFVDQSQQSIVLQGWSSKTVELCAPKGKGVRWPFSAVGDWAECCRQRSTLILRNDGEARSAKADSPEAYASLTRELLCPVFHGGNLIALIGVGNKPNPYDSFDITLVEQLAGIVIETVLHKQVEEEKAKLHRQLIQGQKVESIGRLAGGVAHDFNNILAAMMMHLSLMQQDLSLDRETRQSLLELMGQTKRGASLTRQLLMFSRRSILEVKRLDLNELVENLLKMLGRLIGEHISVRFERIPGLPAIEADPGMVEQVLVNLCVNSRDAMPKGGRLTIRAEAVEVRTQRCPESRPGRFACLSVADTGCGMDDATLQRIFEPFFTTKEPGKGTGLGLATVHGIAGQHKGWVEVESAVGRGTTFRVYFPLAPAGEPSPSKMDGEKLEIMRGHETILLVEDEPVVRRATAQSLGRLGYSVIEAENGRAALVAWSERSSEVDLLLTDMVMPEGMTGLDLANRLLELKPDLKVIVSSGHSEEMAAQGISADKKIVRLQKPYQLESLSQTLRQCLDQK